MAFARAVGVGFAIEHMADLMIFAEQFCANILCFPTMAIKNVQISYLQSNFEVIRFEV